MKLMSTGTASLSSSAFFTPALYAIQNSSNNVANSVARLSSGNRIVNVGDDVASFSVAAGLQSQISGLKQASSNVAQAGSLLQVASGGLQQISALLNTLSSIAVQSNNSALTDTERGYLQTQFSALIDEIDSIANSTTFNNIKLLDGTLADSNQLLTSTSPATKASAHITLTANPAAGETIVLNGATFIADTDFVIGGSSIITATNLATALNNSTNTAISQATYQASGSTITITAKAGGELGNQYVINKAASTAAFTTDGTATNVANKFTLFGGLDNGLNFNSTKATGTIGNSVATAQSQVAASVSLTLSGAVADGETLSLGDGNGGLIVFTFRNAPATSTEIQIGASTEETLQGIIDTVTAYSDLNALSDNFGIRQLEFSVSTNSLVIKNRTVGNVNDINGSALAISEAIANGTVSGASFNNGSTGGLNVSGINNGSFVGTLTGISATYVGADSVTASVTVGSSTYTATITDTTPAADTTIRFSSTSGGYFDLQLDGGQGTTVTNQTTADTYAARLDAAVNDLVLYQDRQITNYSTSNDLLGSQALIQLGNNNNVKIASVSVTAPATPGTDATIEFSINGSTFRASSGLGGTIGANEVVKFTSLDDANEILTFVNGSTAQDFSTEDDAADFEVALAEAFNIDEAGAGTDFQIGPNSTDIINVSIDSARTYSIFNGVTPDVGSQANAVDAQEVLGTAIDTIQTIISEVAGAQSALNAAEANLQTSIIGITSAHSALADTDIASESTYFAQETLKVNAGVAILAQALSLQSSLLGLLSVGGKG